MSRHLDGTGSGHPVTGFLDLLEASLDDVAGTQVWSLGSVETTQVITRLSAALARLAELESRALLHADTLDLPGEIGARSLAAWLARTTRVTMGEARRKTRLAETLQAHDPTRAAVAKGEVLAEQAAVIGSVVDELAEEYADRKGEVEDYLIGKAADFDAHGLKELGRKVVEVIDPDGAEAAEAKRLEEQEKRALKRTELMMSNRGDGTVRGTFILPEATAEMLRKALLAFAAPKHVRATEGAGSYDHERPTPQKMGWAFISYIENYPTDRLPKMGGMAATIIVTVEADVFTKEGSPAGQKAGTTEDGVRVSPGTLLRWSCSAKVMPAVLDTDGHVLDLGRSRRLHTEAQRLALIVEQKTCQHPSCDTIGAFCHVHHTTPWAVGGHTNTRSAVLLCPFHHHQAHAQGTEGTAARMGDI